LGEFLPAKMTADSLLGFMEELIAASPSAVRTNRSGEDADKPNWPHKVFGERVLNREKYRTEAVSAARATKAP
jgi:hypothetical protein